MNHLERLLSRALATPRDAARPLFDPFDQVALLALQAPPPLHVARATGHAAAPALASMPGLPRETLSTQPSGPVPSPVASASAVSPQTPPLAATPQVPAPLAPTTPPQAAMATPAHGTPQGRADAFMRALGVALPEPPAVSPASPAPHAVPVTSRPEAPRVAAPRLATPARGAAIARPPLPGRTPAPVPAPQAASAPAAGGARRAPPAAPIEHVVERTVVVSSSAHGLDELAHASRIVRFGIGQG